MIMTQNTTLPLLSTFKKVEVIVPTHWKMWVFGLLLGGMSTHSFASTAQQVLPTAYQANSYCQGNIKPDVPRGTQHEQFVGDISCLNQRLEPFMQANVPTITRYHAYKARAWLMYAGHEDSEQSLTKAGRFALNEALSILYALENNKVEQLPVTSDIPDTSGLKRPDLWAKLLTIKQTAAFNSLPKEIAFSEVKLIWAEAEFCEFGWRHSREHYSAAERWVDTAENTALHTNGLNEADYQALRQRYYDAVKPLANADKACHGAVLPSLTLPVTPAPVVVPPAPVAPIAYKPYVVHFGLDKAVLDSNSQAVLAQMLSTLQQSQRLNDLTFDLYGFTDSRANAAYNLALSNRRTTAVKDYLLSQGITATQIIEHPEGMSNQKQSAEQIHSNALSRRVEVLISKNGVSLMDKSAMQTEMNQTHYSDLKLDK